MAASAPIRALEKLLRENGLGKALPKLERPRHPPAPSGWTALDDRLGGGLPRGMVSEIIGPESSGRTALVFSLLARATAADQVAAYVDAADSLDPRSAQQAGIVLERLLWIRCDPREQSRYQQVAQGGRQADQAWQATNLVASAGGFGVIVVDLGGLSKRKLRQWQSRQWVRLKQAVEHSPTALVVLAEAHLAGSAAGLTLELSREQIHWRGRPGAPALLDGATTSVASLRERGLTAEVA